MSESAQTSFYGLRSASIEDLIPLVEAGNVQARDELRDRLGDSLAKLLDLYAVVYQRDEAQAIEALQIDLAQRSTTPDMKSQ